MISFILNDQLVNTGKPSGLSLLDFIRYEADLPGTKSGCREGDCGACTVLEGTPENGRMTYKSIVSCLTPLGNVLGKHIVTIEGINMDQLSPVQKAFAENGAAQCGFCTPGFIIALTAYCLSDEIPDYPSAIASISGNICRCTGYKSIERAVQDIIQLLQGKDRNAPTEWLVKKGFLPAYFLNISEKIEKIGCKPQNSMENGILVAGGTDLMVRNAEILAEKEIVSLHDNKDLKFIRAEGGKLYVGAAVTGGELEHSPVLNKAFPELAQAMGHFASRPIRNMATMAGNIVNASPIGDLTIILLALNAELRIYGPECIRSILLKDFYFGYKKIDLHHKERVTGISFEIPPEPYYFNFEKVSKREHLDIASVNSACLMMVEGEIIRECRISAGGVSPVPLLLGRTCEWLKDKTIKPEHILQAVSIMQEEIKPISDVRGSAEYKMLLLRQLLFAHFLKFFPERISLTDLLNN